MIEELTTNTSLPLPTWSGHQENDNHFVEFLMQLFAELSFSLMHLALFMIKHPTGMIPLSTLLRSCIFTNYK